MNLLAQIAGRVHRRAPGANSSRDLVADIIEELELVLGTLRGTVPADPAFGVGDVSLIYQSAPDAATNWCSDTEATLRHYVHRLGNPRVIRVPGPPLDLVFRVKIRGTIVVGERIQAIELEASIDPQRSWRIA